MMVMKMMEMEMVMVMEMVVDLDSGRLPRAVRVSPSPRSTQI